jgi:CheY-like chemotaxis protein
MNTARKILVVDDDPIVGLSFERVLSAQGYLVVTAPNGADALEKLREGEYDVVFTDIKMPGMDGLEVAERVKAKQPWTPVVIVTGYGTSDNESRARAAGVSDFLRKPLSPQMIEQSTLKALLEGVALPVAEAPKGAEVVEAAPAAAPAAAPRKVGRLKSAALLLAAPFIGLAYIALLPIVGMAMLAAMAGRAMLERQVPRRALAVLKHVAVLVAAPFVGLAYIVALPVIGMGMLVVHALDTIPGARRVGIVVKNVALLLAAPFIGLAYVAFLPVVALGALAWVGAKALMKAAPAK